jgi:hypothetical protein
MPQPALESVLVCLGNNVMLAGNEVSHSVNKRLEALLSHQTLSIQASTTLINSPFLTFAIISLIHAHPRCE